MTILEALGRRESTLSRVWPRLDIVAVVTVILLCAIAWARHAAVLYPYVHPDEIITLKVAQRVVARHSLDTNWANADLPPVFKYPQYNFSAYILFSAGSLEFAWRVPWLHFLEPMQVLRKASFALGLLGVLFAFALGRRLFGTRAGVFAALLTAANPLLFQDGLYARPETFVSALTLLMLYVLVTPWPPLARRALAGLILGVLVATKISMIPLAPLLFLADDPPNGSEAFAAGAARYLKACVMQAPATLLVVAPAMALGFFCGAPAVPFHLDAFVGGIRALTTQYTTGQWPLGVPDGNWIERLGFAAAYIVSTAGWPWMLLAIGSAAFLVRERRYRALGVLLIVLVSVLRMSTYAVFFERNLSHLVPILCVLGAFALDRLLATAGEGAPRALKPALALGAVALVIATPAVIIYRLVFVELPGHSRAEVNRVRGEMESRYGVTTTVVGWANEYPDVELKIADRCAVQLLDVNDPGDHYTAVSLAKLKAEGFVQVGRFNSAFAMTSPSTLQIYFTPTSIFYFRDRRTEECESRPTRIVSRYYAAEVLPWRLVSIDRGWTRGGSYKALADPFGQHDYFGSWSGGDNRTGRLAMQVDAGGASAIVLPYVTGPATTGQSISLEDADTHRVLLSMDPVPPAVSWRLLRIRLPQGVRHLALTASDAGTGWGNWLAVGAPRRAQKPGA